jgi:hypothetical protein
MNYAQQYFFNTTATSEVLFVNEDTKRVGINEPNPSFSLDVKSDVDLAGTLYSCNIQNIGLIGTHQLTAPTIVGDYIGSSNIFNSATIDTEFLVATDVGSSNIYSSNIYATNYLQSKIVNAGSDIQVSGYSFQNKCPWDREEFHFPFTAETGYIDISWLKTPVSAGTVLSDIWNLAGTGMDIAGLLYDAYQLFNANAAESAAQQALRDMLEEALNGQSSNGLSSNKISVSWSNLKNVPIAAKNNDIGVRGDMIVADAQSLKVIGANQFSRVSALNNMQMDLANPTTIMNFGTQEAWLKGLNIGSNVWINNSNKSFRLQDWSFGSNTISNYSSNINLINDTNLIGNLSITSSNLNYNSNLLTSKITNGSNYSLITQSNNKLMFNINTTPVLTMDSNTLYVSSNISMSAPATIRGYTSPDLDNPYREGILRLHPDNMRFISMSNPYGSNIENIWFSVTSNGLFAPNKLSLYGKNETYSYFDPYSYSNKTTTNFARLDVNLTNGLTFGSGLSNMAITSSNDFFKVTAKSEIYTNNTATGIMSMHFNSNADFVKPNFTISNNGLAYLNSTPLWDENGSITRLRANDPTQGVKITKQGYFSVGKLTIWPDGTILMGNKILIDTNGVMQNLTIKNPTSASNIPINSLAIKLFNQLII